MKQITWNEFFERLDGVDFDNFDLIVAIGSGGIIPGGFIQQRLQKPMQVIWINYRDDKNNPKYSDAQLLEDKKFELKGKKILVVDDVSRSGKTLSKAKEYLAGNEIKTFVINGKADYNLFDCEECIMMPWKGK